MPPKRYRLKLDHPYAKKGTMLFLEDNQMDAFEGMLFFNTEEEQLWTIGIPLSVQDAWLEEVKEEPTCSKEFAEAFVAFFNTRWNCMDSKLFKWIQEHISNEH